MGVMGGNCCGLARYQTVITIGGWAGGDGRRRWQGEEGRRRSRIGEHGGDWKEQEQEGSG